MFISGLAQFVQTSKEPQVTELDKKEFVRSVLKLTPFKKQFKYGPVTIHFVTPNLKEYALLDNIPAGFDYEDCFALVVLEKIQVENDVVYEKTGNILEDYNKLVEKINNSPTAGFLAKGVTEFYILFKELMKMCGEPDFFG